ncbi:MAG: HEAT repeat domain-containing protein [Candidatus Omnitrophica bacterium]|nr:HEAT repeat domain-containing protein [Candidatus Omnitrophota bacterium]
MNNFILFNSNEELSLELNNLNLAIKEATKSRDNYNNSRLWLKKITNILKTLGEMKNAGAVKTLIDLLNTGSNLIFDRVEVAKALVKIGDDRGIEPIKNLLLTIPEEVRSINDDHGEYTFRSNPVYEDILFALKELEQKQEIKKMQKIERLIKVLTGSNREEKKLAAKELARIGDARGIEPIRNALFKMEKIFLSSSMNDDHGEYSIQEPNPAYEEMLLALNELEEQVIIKKHVDIEPLIKALTISNEETKKMAANILVQILDPRQIDDVRINLADALRYNGNNLAFKELIMKTLGNIGDKRAIDPLIMNLQSLNYYIRGSAADALGNIGDIRAEEALIAVVTNDNNDYVKNRAENALKKIRNGGEIDKLELPSQYNLPQGVDKELVEKAFESGRIDIDSLPDNNLKAFLKFLKENGLNDVVVIGGTVRDIFFRKATDDLDITVKVELSDLERSVFSDSRAPVTPRVETYCKHVLAQLAAALQVDAAEFIQPFGNNEPLFNNIPVQYAGPNEKNRRVLYDSENKKIYPSNTGAGLLQLALDCDGNIYGRKEALIDLLEGKIKVYGDRHNFFSGEFLRLLRLKHQYGLEISEEDYQLIKDTILEYKKGDRSLSGKLKKTAERLIEKIMKNALNPEAAKKELNELGIITKQGDLNLNKETQAVSMPKLSPDEMRTFINQAI